MYIIKIKLILSVLFFFIFSYLFSTEEAFSKTNESKVSINGSGLKIPRMVSLKNSLTYMRSGPGKKFPILFEFNQKGYPVKIIAEYNNWRKITTFNKISGWMHTQLLSSFKTGLITKNTFLKKTPSNSGISVAKLLPKLLINVKRCTEIWCKIEILKDKVFVGWVKKETIWGATKN